MRKVDLFWQSNREWWEFRDHIPVVKASAPPEAQASYQRYLEQMGQNDICSLDKIIHE